MTAVVGAGGKTTAIQRLAQELSSQGKRVAITTTTHILVPQEPWYGSLLLSPTRQQVKEAAIKGICVAAGGMDAAGKLTDIGAKGLLLLQEFFEYLLVEADGSRHMPCKVPAPHEPAIPRQSNLVVGVLGMSALGNTLERACFRSCLAAEMLGVEQDAVITPSILEKIAVSPQMLQKGCCGQAFCLLLNQMEKRETETREVAQRCAASGIKRIVCASLREQEWEIFAQNKGL